MHRYTLEPYSGSGSRIMCPKCRHRRDTFKRYIDSHSQAYLADHVGRCDRQEQCGYHYPPRQYFADNPGLAPEYVETPRVTHETSCPLPWSLVEQTMKAYHRNNFVLFLAKVFGEEKAKELVMRYCIGTASHWPGATVFWQLDYNEQVRAGKVMLYNASTGKRVKQPYNHVTWVHTLLDRKSGRPEDRKTHLANDEKANHLSDLRGLSDFRTQIQQCLFGEHLLAEEPEKIVALTESEKTAIIGSGFEPGYVWLAAGSLEGLNYTKCKVLKHRDVLLFPDVNGYGKWKDKAYELTLKIPTANFIADECLLRSAPLPTCLTAPI